MNLRSIQIRSRATGGVSHKGKRMSTQTAAANVGGISPTPGQHIILDGISWETYERLVSDCQDSHAAHLSYDRGVLEIMVLSFRHETINRTLAHLVSLVAEELQIDTVHAGSTTFKRQDIAQGLSRIPAFTFSRKDLSAARPKSISAVTHRPILSLKLILAALHSTNSPSMPRWVFPRCGATTERRCSFLS